METQRLRTIQIPDRTLGLLEGFASSVLRVPESARRISRLAELPPELRRHIGATEGRQYVWFAWYSDDDRISLLTGALALEPSRERGCPVLEVRSYLPNGLLDEAGVWVRTAADEWARCTW